MADEEEKLGGARALGPATHALRLDPPRWEPLKPHPCFEALLAKAGKKP